MYDLKAHIDKLTDILEEVKLQNNMKDEEIKALRDRMIKMESIIPVQDDSENGEDDELPQRDEDGAGEGTHQPEVRVKRLMDEDPAFRRGRLRWLKQEQQRILNLQQQNITKKLRGQNQNQNQGQNSPVVPVHLPGTGRFIPPQECKLKFPFKSNPAHRLSWGPASAALQALGLGEGGDGGEYKEEGGVMEGKGSPSPPPPLPPPLQGQTPALLPLPFQAPPPRMRTPSPHRAWQQRNQGNFFQNHQHRYRRNSLDSSTHGNSNYENNQHHGGGGGGHQGRPRQRRGVSPVPGGERGGGRGGGGGRDRDGGFHYNQHQHHQYHHHPYYNPHNAPFQPGPHPNYHSLPRSGVPPPPADMLLGVGPPPPPVGWGFNTPPRMRRQFSAPDLKNNKETPI